MRLTARKNLAPRACGAFFQVTSAAFPFFLRQQKKQEANSLCWCLFQECQKKLEHKLGLDSYLLKPVQRITKYQLLLKVTSAPWPSTILKMFAYMDLLCFVCLQELIKYSKGCDGCDDLQEALTSILGILKAVNDSMHLIAITGYEVRNDLVLTYSCQLGFRQYFYRHSGVNWGTYGLGICKPVESRL